MDGFETASRIKKMEGCEDLPIIFITAVYSEDPFVKRGYEVGAIDYFSKPFDPELLRLKVGLYSSYRQKVNLLIERERRISETEELLEAGRKLSSIMEALTVGVVIADSNGKLVLTNEAISKILRTKESLDKDAYGKILSWWDGNGSLLKEENGPLKKALEGISLHNFRREIICLDGSLVNLVISGSPLINPDGGITGAVLVIQDVTESKRLEEDFETKLANLISLGVGFEHLNSSGH
jgi:PAS domain-containing protein